MREERLDVLLREGMSEVLSPPEEQEDWDLPPVRMARRCAVVDRWSGDVKGFVDNH